MWGRASAGLRHDRLSRLLDRDRRHASASTAWRKLVISVVRSSAAVPPDDGVGVGAGVGVTAYCGRLAIKPATVSTVAGVAGLDTSVWHRPNSFW